MSNPTKATTSTAPTSNTTATMNKAGAGKPAAKPAQQAKGGKGSAPMGKAPKK